MDPTGRGRAGRPRKYPPVGREGIGTRTVVRGKCKWEGGQKRDGHHEAQTTRNSERSEGSRTGQGTQSLGGSLKLCAKAGRGRAAGPL